MLAQVPQLDPEAAKDSPATSWAPFKVYNIGNNEPVELGILLLQLKSSWERSR